MSEVSLRSRLIGAWELVNFFVRHVATNAEGRPWREHPLGLILYTHDGYVSAQLQRPGRGPFVSDDPFDATAVEYAAAGSSCVAYSGRFFVDEVGQSCFPRDGGELFSELDRAASEAESQDSRRISSTNRRSAKRRVEDIHAHIAQSPAKLTAGCPARSGSTRSSTGLSCGCRNAKSQVTANNGSFRPNEKKQHRGQDGIVDHTPTAKIGP